jgi:CRISPR-associated protein Cmr4
LAGIAGVPSMEGANQLAERESFAPDDCPCLLDGKEVVLEEFDFQRATTWDVRPIAVWIAQNLLSDAPEFASTRSRFETSLLVLSDDYFTHFVRHATEVTARIRLDYDRKTVAKGALFYQEFLPAETVLYSLLLANNSRAKKLKSADSDNIFQLLISTLDACEHLQLGGDGTTGKGLCTVRLSGGKGDK